MSQQVMWSIGDKSVGRESVGRESVGHVVNGS